MRIKRERFRHKIIVGRRQFGSKMSERRKRFVFEQNIYLPVIMQKNVQGRGGSLLFA